MANDLYLENEELFEVEVLSELPSEVTALMDVGAAAQGCCSNSNSCNTIIAEA